MRPLLLRGQVGGLCLTSTARWAPHSILRPRCRRSFAEAGLFSQGLSWPPGNLPGGEREVIG